MMMTAICYKTTKPMVLNRGTRYEKTYDEFMAYLTYKTPEEAQKEVDAINTNKPEKLFNGAPALCDERTYFVGESEMPY